MRRPKKEERDKSECRTKERDIGNQKRFSLPSSSSSSAAGNTNDDEVWLLFAPRGIMRGALSALDDALLAHSLSTRIQ